MSKPDLTTPQGVVDWARQCYVAPATEGVEQFCNAAEYIAECVRRCEALKQVFYPELQRVEENERLRAAFERICKIGPNTQGDLFVSHMRDAMKGGVAKLEDHPEEEA